MNQFHVDTIHWIAATAESQKGYTEESDDLINHNLYIYKFINMKLYLFRYNL